MRFPTFKSKMTGVTEKFDLNTPEGKKKYFEAKAGYEIKKLKQYLEKSSFIGYMLAKKSAGKGTYARMLVEILGEDKLAHLSVGDIVRSVDEEIADPVKRKELEDYLKANYRGFVSLDEIIKAQEDRSTKTLMPTEFILALVEREISRMGRKAILLDGFPRGLDQVSYSLFFRQLIGYRDDPDFFVLIQLPESIIDRRMKYRVVCPKCNAPHNPRLHPSSKVEYDEKDGRFYMLCDASDCEPVRMISKEGDHLGAEHIRERLDRDEELMNKAFGLYGIPKILLQNAVRLEEAKEMVDDYELTPAFSYDWDKDKKEVIVTEEPWVIEDDEGEQAYSLMAVTVVLSFIHKLVETLGL